MVRQLLNRYTDDDTDGSPIGDLLLNETKYEMGDEAYKALSGAEKKKHADILTMLLQGNLMGISMIEKYLARAAAVFNASGSAATPVGSILVSLAAVHISAATLIVISATLGMVLFIVVAISDMGFEMEEKIPDAA